MLSISGSGGCASINQETWEKKADIFRIIVRRHEYQLLSAPLTNYFQE